ncbi:hypothetical protein F7R25_03975 [Burkholderia stagnalis]|uniref:Uncharacterized protein n=1 Tax=Burkholderia stagnalis TaxID=1503054 RepID=A0A6L3N538_9BURK|nr:hypothetical protein [Burkholderia stagnalis]KAB0640662.1 hypothetical protein F7R25_03975 [Burkholderia stagnalis]VWB06161.1 hypothetical protein BST28156_00105 [Burkholderia stagnalis]
MNPMNHFHFQLPLGHILATQDINHREKPVETILIHVSKREWNIDAINDLYGFGEEDPATMSDLEIANLLHLQAHFEFAKNEYWLDTNKVFVLVKPMHLEGKAGREGYFDDSKPSTHEPYGRSLAHHYEAEDSEDDGYPD